MTLKHAREPVFEVLFTLVLQPRVHNLVFRAELGVRCMFAVFLHWCAALWLVALAAAVRAHPGGCAVLPAPTNIRAADSDGPDRGQGLSHTDPTDNLRRLPSTVGLDPAPLLLHSRVTHAV